MKKYRKVEEQDPSEPANLLGHSLHWLIESALLTLGYMSQSQYTVYIIYSSIESPNQMRWYINNIWCLEIFFWTPLTSMDKDILQISSFARWRKSYSFKITLTLPNIGLGLQTAYPVQTLSRSLSCFGLWAIVLGRVYSVHCEYKPVNEWLTPTLHTI